MTGPLSAAWTEQDKRFIQRQNAFVKFVGQGIAGLQQGEAALSVEVSAFGAMALWEVQLSFFFFFLLSPNTCNHILHIHTPLTGLSGFLSPPYYIVCFPSRRKCSQCRLTQGLSSLSRRGEFLFLKSARTPCQGQTYTQTKLLMFHQAVISLFSVTVVNSWHRTLASL